MPRKQPKRESNPGAVKPKKSALGKGLDALIPRMPMDRDENRDYRQCDISKIRPSRYQARSRFSEKALQELARSIKSQGILQPLLVREENSGYELIAGERRLRAAKLAGLTQVPVIVKELSDPKMLEMSIVENIQRQNLNPIEEATAYHYLIDEFGLTQEKAAARVGKSRSAVANFLRLRQLPEDIKRSIADDKISMGHARALLAAETSNRQLAAWRIVISKQLSVRETEALIKRLQSKKKKSKEKAPDSNEIYFKDLADNLSRDFGTRVNIKRRGQKGAVEIEFYSNEDLDRLLGLLRKT